jgi:cation transport regulator ChaB
MKTFEQYVYEAVRQSLSSIDKNIIPDIYAISFYVYDDDDDPRTPTLQVGYNTKSRMQACTPVKDQEPNWPIASDAAEAKWNFAFWLQNELCLPDANGTEGADLRQAWLKATHLWYSDKDDDSEDDEVVKRCDEVAAEITKVYVELCSRVGRRLHDDGVIVEIFGQPTPVIVHELEYYEEIALQTNVANPPGLTAEFEAWARGE